MAKNKKLTPLTVNFRKVNASFVAKSPIKIGRKKLKKIYNITEDQAKRILEMEDDLRNALLNANKTYATKTTMK